MAARMEQKFQLPVHLAQMAADLPEDVPGRLVSVLGFLHQMLQAGLAQVGLFAEDQRLPLLNGKTVQQRRLSLLGQPEGRGLAQIPPGAGQAGILVSHTAQVPCLQLPGGPAAQVQQEVV